MIVAKIEGKKRLKTPRDFYYDWYFKRKRKQLEQADWGYRFFLGKQIISKFNIECYEYLVEKIGDYDKIIDIFKYHDVITQWADCPQSEITLVLDDPTVREREDYKFAKDDDSEPCLLHIHSEDYVYALTHWDEYMKDVYKDLDHYYGHLYKKGDK